MGIDRPIVGLSDDSESTTGLGSRFSEELVRPVAESTLLETVETMAARSDEAVQKQEYLALAASQAAMEIELSPAETDEHETYEQVTSRIEDLRSRIDVPLEEFEDELADSLT
ncbi:HalX domain-containing protein [Halorientalis brevis]|uniref:HalX domain-containing protein n=1 Tax=Halorientalis brevis TaxID=1126241 RepID=A0ABD6CAD9_9EURY|nr:HalX domain-containing protein [Halorientalis brevis]